jgi:hypothetical protein
MGEYIRQAAEAGLVGLSVPEIAYGKKLAEVLAPEGSCCGTDSVAQQAAASVASIKLHGRKP